MAPVPKGTNRRWVSTETRVSAFFCDGAIAPALEVPALTVLAHSDYRRIGELVTLTELMSDQPVGLSRVEPLFAAPGSGNLRPLEDPHLSRKPLRLVPVGGLAGTIPAIRVERAACSTALLLAGEPVGAGRLVSAPELASGVVLELGSHVVLLLHLQPAVAPRLPTYGLVGDSGAVIRLRQEIQRGSRLEAAVLLRGASGTGKELVAHALHDAGSRAGRPCITVNMAAVPPPLAAAELFGAQKGAFTGADTAKPGFFAAANGGTLFLDEIGETPLEVQALLLRALETGEIQPVGSGQTRRVDVRLIAATDADLEAAVAAGRFRAPLLHRLAGWEIRLPTLAERRADLGRLLAHFLDLELRALGEGGLAARQNRPPWPPASLVADLARCDWPGNVRQLRNVARRLAVTTHTDPDANLASAIASLLAAGTPQNLPKSAEPAAATVSPAARTPPIPGGISPTGRWRPIFRQASEISEDALRAALRASKWELKPAAQELGISRSVLYQLIEKCPRIRIAAQLEPAEIEQTLARHGGELLAAAAELEVSVQGLKLRMRSLGLRELLPESRGGR